MGIFDDLPPAPPDDELRPDRPAWRRHQDRSYWVWPLPPRGPVTFACRWTGHGISDSRAEVDGQLIRDAAAHSTQLWPDGSQPPGALGEREGA